ncbi:zinc metalloprotease [Sphingopyxis bauzanensis]|uniref:Zinc metalloprotease n=1 Tax=Sphingopyxis bauzanensis TaxID=651663 RepID=A0A246JRQ0_9SPHN|nr:neutral zinc metallopeptidase [Sphingopyxis bauzanensis]OWQ95526.1 zinc metalloprotease [Sphingopyxis bauzanensis]GGJ62563.1 neutral zinc metallopeptidase [Sphingopyxis bauzanensis]
MRLDDYDPGDDIRDLGRGGGGGFGGGGGGLGGLLIGFLPMLLGRKMGCGTILLIGAVAFFLLGPGANMLSSGGGIADPAANSRGGANVACDTASERFACNVFGSTHTVWEGLISGYRKPTLTFYSHSVDRTACGSASSAMGPFYCPGDQGVYLDTDFFRDLELKFGAAGDAAQAYVIAHEVGHHIQTISGISNQVRQAQQRASQAEGNALQVRMELQADCYAGVWAARAKTAAGQPVMEAGDMEEAMRAANAIGDDTLMRSAGQRPVPESFTHGTSEQRMSWLRRGLQSGDPRQCDAFASAL